MGGKAKIILPLIALGVGAVATGGFGLLGAGAAGGTGAGITGSTIASNVITATGLTPAAASLVPASAGSLALSSGTGALNLSLAGGIDAAVNAGAAPTGFFAQIGQSLSNLTPLEKINFAFSGINAAAQQNALSGQENESKLSEANNRLDLASKDLDNQRGLQKSLATQSNFFAASGINASRGSAAQLQNNAFGNASLAQDKITAGRSLLGAGTQLRQQSFQAKRGNINRDFAKSTYSTLFDKKKPVI